MERMHRFEFSVYDNGWTTQLYPYVGNLQQYACPEATKGVLAGTSGSGPLISYTYNGHLHHFNAAGVVNPAQLPVLWEGIGKRAVAGYAISQPILKCSGKMPKGRCRYVNGAPPNSFLFKPLGGVGIHNGRLNIAYADTHVRSIPVGKGDPKVGNPFTYDVNGNPNGFWSDGNHAWTFRPEHDFREEETPKRVSLQPLPVAR